MFVNFVYLLKEPVFLLILTIFSFISFSFISDLILMISSTNFVGFFFLLVIVVLGVKLGCLFDVFLVS